MTKTKRIFAILLAVTIAVSLLAAMPLAASAKTVNNVNDASSLKKALDDDNVKVINISDSFTYNHSILITYKKIDLNLNGHTLNVAVSEGYGIQLRYGSRLSVNGPGTLNVTAETTAISSRDSVFTTTGASVVNAVANGATVLAVHAEDRGMVAFAGSISASGSHFSAGIYAYSRGVVDFTGDVTTTGNNATYGVYSGWRMARGWHSSSVKVTGNVTVSGTNSTGVYANSESVVDIFGNVTATSAGSIGAFVHENGKVFITGSVSGDQCAIRANSKEFSVANPTNTNVRRNAPRNEHTWIEYNNDRASVYLSPSSVTVSPADPAAPKTSAARDGEWRYSNKHWYYYNSNGNMVKNSWIQGDDGNWYYVKFDGRMVRNGWFPVSNELYYFNSDGTMATDRGRDGSKYVLLKPDGTRESYGWHNRDGAWYYLNSKGEAQTGIQMLDGVAYYFYPGGAMAAGGWIDGNGAWYYSRLDGTMVTNETINIDGKDYTFNSVGICMNP